MAHFARINAQGLVSTVIVAEQEFIDGLEDSDSWIQTSYNTHGGKHYDPETRQEDAGTPLRKNYAGVGYTYDSVRDAFIPPQPFASWSLDEDSCLWNPPHECPALTEQEELDGKYYIWSEELYNADNTQGWSLVGGSV